jgi:capsular exopolysaccharide synthesis family protein
MERAEVPKFPIAPNPRRDWISAILAGITIAFGLAFGIEYLDDTVKTPEDISRRLGLPLLGLVPAVRGDHVPILSETVPHDFGEAFRSLRTSLVFTSGSEHTRVIAVTSSQPLEGKTTTAANLALALALGGSRVLLIDADMRRPGLHKTMGLENQTGLSHLLAGQARVRDAIQRTAEPNLIAISAGRTPPNPSELLGSERMNNFLANLQHGPFDWVIIDTPPVLAVTDAVILAPRVSGVVFVIGSEMTRRVHADRALQSIRQSRPHSIAAVLNRVDFDRNKYYYSRYYGYQYKSYYGQNTSTSAA